MGAFAQTDIEIVCKNKAVAKKVTDIIKQAQKKNKNNFNFEFSNLNYGKDGVSLYKSSGRIQNLEYQCEVLWDLIKKVKGVKEINAPFMVETDGMYFSTVRNTK